MHESSAEMYALATVLTMTAIIAVVLRLHARRLRKTELAGDDYTIILALFFTIVTAICMFVATAAGDLGRHTQMDRQGNVGPFPDFPFIATSLRAFQGPVFARSFVIFFFHGGDIESSADFSINYQPIFTHRTVVFQQTSYASLLSATLTFGLTKLSVLLLYKRIFRGRFLVTIVWILAVLVLIWTMSFFAANMFQCYPISENWTGMGGTQETCIDENMMYLGQAFSDSILDLMILVVPIPCIWSLQMSVKHKLGVSSMFFLGALTIASSCAKLAVFYDIVWKSYYGDEDVSYLFTPTMYWPLVESSLGIVGACLPLLKPIAHILGVLSPMQSLRMIISFPSLSSLGSRKASRDATKPEEGSDSATNSQGFSPVHEDKAVSDRIHDTTRKAKHIIIKVNEVDMESNSIDD